MKKVSVLGLGYVGLPLLCAVAKSKKYKVVGYNHSIKNVKMIEKKQCPITDDLCEKELKELDLEVSIDPEILSGSDIFVICVPTPVLEDYIPDYGPLIESAELVAKYLTKGSLVIVESTVNPGTCDEVVMPILLESGLKEGEFTLAHCPERINPGDVKWNLYNIPRNIGASPEKKVSQAAKFYETILDCDINRVSCLKVAEATKIVENTFRDVNIAYVNELARSFDTMGIDLVETLHGASNKPFAFMAHWPSRGVGGHCIAVDPYYLISRAAKSGFNHEFLKIAREVNNGMPKYTVGRLQEALNDIKMPVKGTKVLLLGLSYKENVADLRESPCLEIKKILEKRGADLKIYEPYVPEMSNVSSLEEGLKDVSAIVLCTAHKEFLKLNRMLENYPKIKVIVDGMNKLDKQKITDLGIMYRGIGR